VSGVRAVSLDLGAGDCQVFWRDPAACAAHVAADFVAALTLARRKEASGALRCPIGRGSWPVWTSRRLADGLLVLRARETRTGRLRIRIVRSPGRRPPRARVSAWLAACPGIRAVRIGYRGAGLDVDFDPAWVTPVQVLDAVSESWPTESQGRLPDLTDDRAKLATGSRRLFYLALGTGSLAMAVIGLVLPGVPTVPFLLASSYYLARSSPALHRRLLASRLFGRLLREWQTHRALSRESKLRLAGFVAIAIVVSVALAPLNPALVATVAVMLVLSLYGIYAIPQLDALPANAPI
ncbi:MAG: DUF454 domain-containing protein, partial [Gammaproteobacteria bacterium]|nr:DUF454 domain-containing protein [Gammaproteobacteria bacterium]